MGFYDKASMILGLPKSIRVNFKYFPAKVAIKFPILISKDTVIKSVNGKVILPKKINTGIIKFGFGNVGIFDKKRSKSIWQVEGEIIFNGKADFGHGSRLSVNKEGKLIVGQRFNITAESSIVCNKNISIGEECLVSWDCLIMDTDFHKIKNSNGGIINKDNEILIGNKVWIGCKNTILKGSIIGDNTVVAANSTVCRKMTGENQIIGGNPCCVLKSNITWEK